MLLTDGAKTKKTDDAENISVAEHRVDEIGNQRFKRTPVAPTMSMPTSRDSMMAVRNGAKWPENHLDPAASAFEPGHSSEWVRGATPAERRRHR